MNDHLFGTERIPGAALFPNTKVAMTPATHLRFRARNNEKLVCVEKRCVRSLVFAERERDGEITRIDDQSLLAS